MSKDTKNKGGRPTKYKQEYCQLLLDHMEQGLSYETFCAVIGVSKQTLYDWEKANPEFLDAKREAFAKCLLFYEKAGHAGMLGKITGFNATTWIFNMKNRFNWRDKQEVEQTGNFTVVIAKEDKDL